MNMILVEGATFSMGNTREDSEGYGNEKPEHEVKLTYDYWIGKYEVTFDEYDAYTKEMRKSQESDSGWGRGTRPVINVSWWDAIGYCNWLSEKEGLAKAYDREGNLIDANGNKTTDIKKVEGYRLPTEAEWEYAARGGQKASKDWKYSGSDTLSEVGWYSDNSGGKTQETGKKKANELGIFDMSGNVWEWCHNWHANTYTSGTQTDPIGPDSGYDRVLRGGSWGSNAEYCHVTSRRHLDPSSSGSGLGFRCVRTCT